MWRLLPVLALIACSPGPLNVVERTDPSAASSCTTPESCTSDYLAFPTVAADHAAPITEAALEQQLFDLDAGVVPVLSSLDGGDLGERLVESLAVRFLLAGLDERALEVIVTRRTDTDTHRQDELLLRDPYVGTFEAILVEPKSGGPFPAVLALHGHGDSAAKYRDHFGGLEYPAHGYALLMITSRAMNIDADEHEVSRVLLRSGFTLMGLRTYEALLAFKYLRWRPDVIHDRIGLIGHSGGSSTGNLLVRFEPDFRVYVSDHLVDWRSSGATEPYHCETVPALYPLSALINDFATSATPVRKVTYGYPEGFTGIFAFFDRHLKPR